MALSENNTIDFSRTTDSSNQDDSSYESTNELFTDMYQAIDEIFYSLKKPNTVFDGKEVFKKLNSYIYNYHRILYSNVSSIIYSLKNETVRNSKIIDNDSLGTVISNLDFLVDKCNDSIFIDSVKDTIPEHELSSVPQTIKAVWKLWDHVNLANMQYEDLRQSDAEYEEKFRNQISGFKNSISKEMNAQLITMVGIFTALAFILFGGISSLDNLFSGFKNTDLFPTIVIGCIWGLAILNVIFVFLFSIGKMTNLSFKSTHNPKASFGQRYPVVVWTDFLLIAIMVFALWTNYCLNRQGLFWLDTKISKKPMLVSIIGFIVVFVVFVGITILLTIKTRAITGDEDE